MGKKAYLALLQGKFRKQTANISSFLFVSHLDALKAVGCLKVKTSDAILAAERMKSNGLDQSPGSVRNFQCAL